MWPRKAVVLSALLCAIFLSVELANAKQGGPTDKKGPLEEITDAKEFKKLLRTKNNVLVLFVSTTKRTYFTVKMFKEAAEAVKGQGTLAFVDCYGENGKKMCKKLKVKPDPQILRHYKDGEFNRDYDRQLSVTSIVNFMRDPTGDVPWEEDADSADVMHIPDISALNKAIKKEAKPLMVMFYAPWCGFCKTLKPEYAEAAKELRGQAVMAAIDVNRPENSAIRQLFNITGFPTLLYFENGAMKYTYEGDNKRDALISFMKDPQKQPEKVVEKHWSDSPSEVLHLTKDTFEDAIKEHSSLLVMFYAPWCGHCKKMKPEYEQAAEKLKSDKVAGRLAAVDATREGPLASQFNVRGYPSIKYFKDGQLAFDANVREADKIIEFMKDPKEPPPPPAPEKAWSEETSEVAHLTDETFKPFLKKKKHVLVMFYAPWCGHCKKAKPEFNTAAEKFKEDPKVEFAAVDCTAQQSVCSAYDVKGYPTIKYFSYLNKEKFDYAGGRTADDFISFMNNPQSAPPPPPPPSPHSEWGHLPGAEHLLHLTESNFTSIDSKDNVLVMFYAPWCGHCKAMKGDYAVAAEKVQQESKNSWLATVDATAQQGLQRKFNIRGFPTLKLFKRGREVKDYDQGRGTADLVAFMKTAASAKDEL
ncbi:protein disulfide-isomerase A5 [Cloeon dipterum]|uniref:protein disulfide-isomerase A5 n=1 Tax=Cloeon dipterum TaxID=197152 RepID=UPI00322056F3